MTIIAERQSDPCSMSDCYMGTCVVDNSYKWRFRCECPGGYTQVSDNEGKMTCVDGWYENEDWMP